MNQYNDLRVTERSNLAAAQEAFLRSGGKIDVLQTFEFKPLPPRIEPQLTQEEIELRQMADQIRTLSATMFKLEMSKTMGISQDRIQKICKQFGIKLSNGSGRKPNSKGAYTIDPEEDKRLVERLRALAEVGVTKHKARAQVDIGWHKLQRLVEQYKLPFPSRAK
jgi:DNA-binding Xre family transcriptional regulator